MKRRLERLAEKCRIGLTGYQTTQLSAIVRQHFTISQLTKARHAHARPVICLIDLLDLEVRRKGPGTFWHSYRFCVNWEKGYSHTNESRFERLCRISRTFPRWTGCIRSSRGRRGRKDRSR